MKTNKISRKIREHKQYTEVDYEYLSRNGYTNSEIVKLWDRDAAQGVPPVTFYKKIPDIVGYLNRKPEVPQAKTATAEYDKLQRQNAELLKLIAAELKNHETRAKKGNLHYGHVGDIQHTKQLLKELLTSLRGAYDEAQMHAKIEKEINQ